MRPPRTFPAPYEDKRVRRPEFPLAEAVSWYLEDARGEVADTTWPTYGERGEFIIEAESGTKRGTNGVRTVPMEPLAMGPIREYVRLGRPAYIGAGDEPLFLTDDGRPFTREGWAAMAQRLRRQIAT